MKSSLRLSVPKRLALQVEGQPHVVLATIVAIAMLALSIALLR